MVVEERWNVDPSARTLVASTRCLNVRWKVFMMKQCKSAMTLQFVQVIFYCE